MEVAAIAVSEKRGPFIERVRRLRRSRGDDGEDTPVDRFEALERRIEQLEAALEGLQDAMHRESTRQGDEITALRRRTEPGEMARSLSDDARKRGI
jgi:vacuolar-type H+-ATPase subunit I/STV1